MNISAIMTRDYENLPAFCLIKNKANFLAPGTTRGWDLSITFSGAEGGFEITFNPGPVENDMHYHQNDEQGGQIEMDVTPFVAGHRQQRFNPSSSAAPVKFLTTPARAGRQYVLDNKTGKSQTEQVEKANRIDDKIQRYAFHCMSTFIKKEIT